MIAFAYRSFFAICFFIIPLYGKAQLPQYQLNRLQEEAGLKTTGVINIARDKKGFMWIATQSSVQLFDGRHTLSFPFSEMVTRVLIDKRDRKWAVTRNGIYLFTGISKGFKRIPIENTNSEVSSTVYETSDGKLFAASAGKYYLFDEQAKFMSAQPIAAPSKNATNYAGQYEQTIFFSDADSIFSVRQSTRKAIPHHVGTINTVFPLNDNELLVSNTRYKTFYVNLASNEIKLLGEEKKQAVPFGDKLVVFDGLEIQNGNYLFCSNKGLFEYNIRTHTVSRPVFYYDGKPFENQSSVTTLYKDQEGFVYINHADGILFFHSNTAFIQYLRNYNSGPDHMPGNDVRNFAEDEEGNIWMATTNGIAKLHMGSGQLKSLHPLSGKSLIEYPSYRQLWNYGNQLWIGTAGNGVWIYNKKTGEIKRPLFSSLTDEQEYSALFNNAYVWELLMLANKKFLVVGGNVLFTIDANTTVSEPVHINMKDAVSRSAMQDLSGRIWHGTNAGLVCYDTSFNTLLQLKDSFPDKRIAGFCEWKRNKILIATRGLFEIEMKGNTIVSFSQKKAIPSSQFVYCMKQDKKGFVWIGTDDGIFRYDPTKDAAIRFDRSDHVQSQFFNSDAGFLSSSGIMFMGGKNGVNFFNPDLYKPLSFQLKPVVLSFSANSKDTAVSSLIQIPYSNNYLSFIISAPEFKKPFQLQYRYRLTKDEPWIYTAYNNQATISKLSPGDYSLQVSASYDGSTWYDGHDRTNFTVLKPWWQTWWFRTACIAVALLIAWRLAVYSRRKKEEWETKKTIEYFTYSGSADASADLILWDIARNCIARLGFEDCVIYLLDEQRNMLVQKAAYGAKNTEAFEINNPIEIPVGKGITGYVAQQQKAIVINDTTKDERYIVDDEQRLSEIAVPILHDGKLIGVIDSEHRKKGFFTRHHLNTLQTIASLCASKIATAVALEAAKKAEDDLLVLNGKMMESKFTNLRLQMNPHFLFNVLTTIQYLIVSNQVNKAIRYVDIFSGFLRSLLNHAEATVVTLEEELRILTMYVELESLCLDESFVWNIKVAEEIDQEEVMIPFMLLQPFVENAINHGLIHKVGEKRFSIHIMEYDEDSLLCIIEDNGIGRKASAAINGKNLSRVVHQSKGISIVQQRLQLLQEKTQKIARFEIEDMQVNEEAAGTRVRIITPHYSTEMV